MNNFARIILVANFNRVRYYSVILEGEELALFKQFLDKHTAKHRIKLNHLIKWIQKIGNDVGAKEGYFRHEGETADTSALPPLGKNRAPTYVQYNEESGEDENTTNDLRLYCLRANEHVVFLFNGDIKTANTAQECNNVRPHFRLANKLTECINTAFGDQIKWNRDRTDIMIENGFELNW